MISLHEDKNDTIAALDAEISRLRAELSALRTQRDEIERQMLSEAQQHDETRAELSTAKARERRLREALVKSADTFGEMRRVNEVIGRGTMALTCAIAETGTRKALGD